MSRLLRRPGTAPWPQVLSSKSYVVIHNALMQADMVRMQIVHTAFPSTAAFAGLPVVRESGRRVSGGEDSGRRPTEGARSSGGAIAPCTAERTALAQATQCVAVCPRPPLAVGTHPPTQTPAATQKGRRIRVPQGEVLRFECNTAKLRMGPRAVVMHVLEVEGLCPATVPLTASASFNGICNRQ